MCKGIILNGESLYLLCGCYIIAIYWTNSNTCGEIVLNLIDRKCKNIDSFAMAQYHFSEIEKKLCNCRSI